MSSPYHASFLLAMSKYLPQEYLPQLRERTVHLSDQQLMQLQTIQFHDPTTLLLLSIFLGSLGVDRFILGDTGLGVGKLLTAGGCGIWALIDIFLIMDAARQKNMAKLEQVMATLI